MQFGHRRPYPSVGPHRLHQRDEPAGSHFHVRIEQQVVIEPGERRMSQRPVVTAGESVIAVESDHPHRAAVRTGTGLFQPSYRSVGRCVVGHDDRHFTPRRGVLPGRAVRYPGQKTLQETLAVPVQNHYRQPFHSVTSAAHHESGPLSGRHGDGAPASCLYRVSSAGATTSTAPAAAGSSAPAVRRNDG